MFYTTISLFLTVYCLVPHTLPKKESSRWGARDEFILFTSGVANYDMAGERKSSSRATKEKRTANLSAVEEKS